MQIPVDDVGMLQLEVAVLRREMEAIRKALAIVGDTLNSNVRAQTRQNKATDDAVAGLRLVQVETLSILARITGALDEDEPPAVDDNDEA